MKVSQLIIILTVTALTYAQNFHRNNPCNGGYPCAACTVALGIVEQLGQFHNKTVTQAMEQLCTYFPSGEFKSSCFAITEFFGPVVADLVYLKATPDVVCHHLKFCNKQRGSPTCHLFPEPQGGLEKSLANTENILFKHASKMKLLSPDIEVICKLPGIDFICHIINKMETTFHPVWDVDNDGFSILETLRGSNWRGKDCNDLSSMTHPGSLPQGHDIESDTNCNGIYGIDSEAGEPYEDLLCSGSGQRGVVALGDSVSAHFHIPKEWVLPNQLGSGVLKHLPFVIENQLDWPMMSAFTGYKNITWPIIHGPVRSLYMKMRDRNRCNHRDYQNLGVNGADIFKVQNYQLSLVRDKLLDQPVLLTLALVGNDVCNGMPHTLDYMTTVQQMRTNLMKTLHYLDDLLPKGSFVLMTGLADGRVLYDLLHGRFHPFGMYNGDVTYPDFYDYLNCLGVSPCAGWMSTNATLRNLTSDRAMNLSLVVKDIAEQYRFNFSSFEVNYVDCPMNIVIKEWEAKHGKGSAFELIDPMDGFHPNQYAQALIADYGWGYLEKYLPHYLGKVNPNNAKIKSIFGDQGGH